MPTTEMVRSPSLSLYDIESGLLELQDALDEALEIPDQADREVAVKAIETAMREYVEREVRKVTGIASYIRHCSNRQAEAEAEAARIQAIASRWKARAQRMKDTVLYVMQSVGIPKLEAATAKLRRQGNGGLQPLTIGQPALVPASCRVVKLEMPEEVYASLELMIVAKFGRECGLERHVKSVEPDTAAIRGLLKLGPVAGCRLESRGEHLRVE